MAFGLLAFGSAYTKTKAVPMILPNAFDKLN